MVGPGSGANSANNEAEDDLIRQLSAANAGDAGMDRLTPTEIRHASAAFAVATSDSADGFHPRHFGWLSDAVLACWAELWALTEEFGVLPDQLARAVVPLIPKAGGKLRPISAQPALHRVARRARKKAILRWAEVLARQCFAARRG